MKEYVSKLTGLRTNSPATPIPLPRWVQQAIYLALAYNSRLSRLPVHVHNQLLKIIKMRAQLTQRLGRYPTRIEMATGLGITMKEYQTLLDASESSKASGTHVAF